MLIEKHLRQCYDLRGEAVEDIIEKDSHIDQFVNLQVTYVEDKKVSCHTKGYKERIDPELLKHHRIHINRR